MNVRTTTHRSSKRGFTTINILPIVFLSIVGFLGVAGFVTQQMQLSRMTRSRYAARQLAESGIDSATQQLIANQSFTGETGTLDASNTLRFGSFTTTIARVNNVKWKVTSVGTYRDGTKATVAAIVQISQRNPGSAAIIANGDVRITGNANIQTTPANQHKADVLCNGDARIDGSAVVDGTVGATGTVDASGGSVWGTYSGMDPLSFPDAATMTSWKTGWKAQAMAGGTINGNVSNSMTITGSRYINGNINLVSNRAVVLQGPGVVYVKGNVDLGSQSSLTNGCILVVEGTFTMNGQAIYRIDQTVTNPTPSLFIYGGETDDADDVTCSLLGGASNDSFGIVTLCYGSLKVGGNSNFTGSIMVNQGEVEVKVVGTYNHYYPTDLSSPVQYPNKVGVQNVVEL